MNNKKIQITVLLCAVLVCVALVICAVIIGNNNEGDDPINNSNYTVRSKAVSYTHFNTVSTLSSYGDVSEEEFESYVKTAGEIKSQRFVGPASEFGGNLSDSYSVFVNNTVETLVFFRIDRKILDGTEIVAYREVAAGLNARI